MSRSKKVKIIKKTSGTKEWADHNVNCINGCFNDCKYCYAKMMAKRFGRATEQSWQQMSIRNKAVQKRYGKVKGRIMFPTAHDIFDFPEFLEAEFLVLDKLLKGGNEVLITTKPRETVIKQIHARFNKYKDSIQFRFTITSNKEELLKYWEPNAPPFAERLECLKFAFLNGYKTSVSIEPFLDFDPSELISLVAPYTTESIWLGKMNYIPRVPPIKTKDSFRTFVKTMRKNTYWKFIINTNANL